MRAVHEILRAVRGLRRNCRRRRSLGLLDARKRSVCESALGASRGKVHALIFREGFGVVAVGVVIGIALSIALLRTLQGRIPGLGLHDPAMVGIAVAIVTTAAAMACWLPAYRATKVGPMVALRYE